MAIEGDGELGANLRKERVRRGHTQKTLGAILDLGRGTVASIESGTVTNPGVYTLYRIAVALGVPMEDLMGVPRVAHTTKGRSANRAQFRARRATADGTTVAAIAEEIADRAKAMKVGPYEMPDAEDWAMWTDGADVPQDEIIEAGVDYARTFTDDSEVEPWRVVAGAFVFAFVVASVRAARRNSSS